MVELNKCFRCGYCGQPTDYLGAVIALDVINEMNADWEKAEQVHGECCRDQQAYRNEFFR